jgi:Protein of unknown function (DUF3126)
MKDDVPRLERYLRKLFGNDNLKVVAHPKKNDMAELLIGDEFIGSIYRDEEDGEISFPFQMAILEIDLDEV